MPKYLKRANLPTIIVFLIWNIALFLVFFKGAPDIWGGVQERVAELKARDSLFCFLTPLFVAIASGILPASWKATLVFWRLRYALPGCRVYSKIAKKDDRIDEAKLNRVLKGIPTSPREENALWYKWYKTVEDQITVREAHKNFLLNRDLTGISFLFFVFGTIAMLFSQAMSQIIIIYSAILFLQYLVFSIVARNHGNRFVCNVIVQYLNKG